MGYSTYTMDELWTIVHVLWVIGYELWAIGHELWAIVRIL